MFKVVDNPTFKHKIGISVPVDGGFETQTMDVTYNVIPTDDYAAAAEKGAVELCKRLIARLDDIADQDGAPLEYNDALRDQLIDQPFVRIGILTGYNDGVVGARAKN